MLEAYTIIIGYLLGSFPTAYIAGRITRGIDIRQIGGGNMGALNSTRELGLKAGLIVLFIDIAKGAGAVLIARALDVTQIWVFLAGFAAVIGHCCPAYLKFRGGKGAATALGVLFSLAPLPFLCALPILLTILFTTSNITLSVSGAFLFLPLFLWLFGFLHTSVYAILVALFLAFRYVPTALRSLRKSRNLGDFIFEKNYNPWQTPKNKPPSHNKS